MVLFRSAYLLLKLPMLNRFFCVGFLIAVAGCEKPLLPTVPVTGKLLYRGRPVQGGWVAFIDPLIDGKGAVAITDIDGNFSPHTPAGGDRFVPGMLPSDYVVIVGKTPASSVALTEPGPPSSEVMAQILLEAEQTPVPQDLEAARARANSLMPINRVDPASMTLLPLKYADLRESGLKASVVRDQENHFIFVLTD